MGRQNSNISEMWVTGSKTCQNVGDHCAGEQQRTRDSQIFMKTSLYMYILISKNIQYFILNDENKKTVKIVEKVYENHT